MQTSKTVQVRFDSRTCTAVVSSGRRARKMSPCIVTNAEGTTVVTEKSKKTAKGV